MGWGGYYRPYVPVAQRRANAQREARRLVAKGKQVSPVQVSGRVIASTFWGKAWCDNLESYSDFSNRLPRGRTYVRNGSVVDLQIEPGKVTSLVSGSSLYRIVIQVRPLAQPRWEKLRQRCDAGIGSLVELLQGRLSKSVMAIVTSRDGGLFPEPAEIEMSCSCPDWADMCKHVAATLYGVGCRLDHNPELLFKLRQVDHLDLIAQAGRPAAVSGKSGRKTITNGQLADVFNIELDTEEAATRPVSRKDSNTARDRNRVPSEQEKEDGADTPMKQRKASPASRQTASPKRKVLTASQRKRMAEAQKKRWQKLHQEGLPTSDLEPRPSSAKKSAKAKTDQPVPKKSARRPRVR